MRRNHKAPGNSQAGQAMVEAALVMPLLVLMLFTVVFFGQAFVDYSNAVTAARYANWIAGREGLNSVDNPHVRRIFFPNEPSNMDDFTDESPDLSNIEDRLSENEMDSLDSALDFFTTIIGFILGIQEGYISYELEAMQVDTSRLGFGSIDTAIDVKGYNCVDMDSWMSGTTQGTIVRLGAWGYAFARSSSGPGDGTSYDEDSGSGTIDAGWIDIPFPPPGFGF